MKTLKKLSAIPANFSAFLDEMLPEYTALYGTLAAQHYSNTIHASLSHTLSRADVYAYGLEIGDEIMGMVIGLKRFGAGYIVFIHVLQPYRDQALETELLHACVQALERNKIFRFVSETIPLYPVNLDNVFELEGFLTVERALMHRNLTSEDVQFAKKDPTLLSVADEPDAARLLLEAYRDHPDCVLHQEVQQYDAGVDFLRRFRTGELGAVQPEWMQILHSSNRCCALIMGHAISQDVGYIFQLAVHPDQQRHGLARTLLQSLISEMARGGMKQLLLGVTCTNPAFALYEDFGFKIRRKVNAYVRAGMQK